MSRVMSQLVTSAKEASARFCEADLVARAAETVGWNKRNDASSTLIAQGREYRSHAKDLRTKASGLWNFVKQALPERIETDSDGIETDSDGDDTESEGVGPAPYTAPENHRIATDDDEPIAAKKRRIEPESDEPKPGDDTDSDDDTESDESKPGDDTDSDDDTESDEPKPGDDTDSDDDTESDEPKPVDDTDSDDDTESDE
jgi:hypothetical protein